MDRIDTAEKAAIAALKKSFAGKTVGAQVATTLEHFLRTHMADAVKVRTYGHPGKRRSRPGGGPRGRSPGRDVLLEAAARKR